MKMRMIQWGAALMLSAFVHMALAGIFAPGPDEVLIAGSSDEGVTVLGDAFADAQMAGEASDESDTVEPTELSEADMQELDPTAEPAEPAEVDPVETVSPETSEVEPADTATDDVPLEATEAPTATQAEVEPTETAETDSVAEVAAVQAEPQEIEAIEPVPEVVPLPRPKPPVAAKPDRPRKQEKARARPSRQAKGSGGYADADSRQSREAQSQGRKASVAGNAAVSNYPGKVARKLRRAVRFPSGAGSQGEARVSFVVDRNGNVGSVRVARSSGSAELDRAAAEAVRRAAPFPPIPDGAGRSSWQFVVPIRFDR
jgi:periplasmic protein TonB